jgi:uncharacterized membrane protein
MTIEGITKKRCVSFCHSAESYFSKVFSIKRNIAIKGQEKKRELKGEIYQQQKTFALRHSQAP